LLGPAASVLKDEGKEKQQAAGQQSYLKLPEAAKNRWRNDHHENAAQGAAGRDREKERRQVPRCRFGTRQFPVANHAHDKQGCATPYNLQDCIAVVSKRSRLQGQANSKKVERPKNAALIPTIAVESENKGDQVDAKRNDPQEWYDREILAQKIRGGEEDRGGAGAESYPKQVLGRLRGIGID
jgi:hypothetical protein